MIEQIFAMREKSLLEMARKPEFKYEETFETKGAQQANDRSRLSGVKVILSNKSIGQLATKCSKLAKSLAEITRLKKEYEDLKAGLDDDMRTLADQVFDAEDALATRLIETESMIAKITKKTIARTQKFNEEKFWKKLADSGLAEDLLEQMKLLYKTSFDIVETEKKSAVSTELKESFDMKAIGTKIKNLLTSFVSKFRAKDKKIQKTLFDLNKELV